MQRCGGGEKESNFAITRVMEVTLPSHGLTRAAIVDLSEEVVEGRVKFEKGGPARPLLLGASNFRKMPQIGGQPLETHAIEHDVVQIISALPLHRC